MNFQPVPIIPQTPHQAAQRDLASSDPTPLAQTPEAQLAVLHNAIRQHQDTVEAAGALRIDERDLEHNQPIFDAKHEADRTLWAHLET